MKFIVILLSIAMLIGMVLMYNQYREDKKWWDDCIAKHSVGYCSGQLQAR